MPPKNVHGTTKRGWLLAAIILLAIVVVAGGTLLVLERFVGRTMVSKKEETSVVKLSPQAVVDNWGKQGTIAALGATSKSISQPSTLIYFRQASKSYTVSIASPHVAVRIVPSGSADQTAAIVQETADFAKQNGLTAYALPTSAVSHPDLTTYANKDIVCQLDSSAPTQDASGTYTFGCTDEAAIAQEYTAVAQLVSLYDAKQTPFAASEVDRGPITTDGDKSMTVVTFADATHQASQLFAALNGSWEFMVTLSDGTQPTNGKYVASDAVEAALHDPRYGDFLVNNLN